jgi:hypothetical protein
MGERDGFYPDGFGSIFAAGVASPGNLGIRASKIRMACAPEGTCRWGPQTTRLEARPNRRTANRRTTEQASAERPAKVENCLRSRLLWCGASRHLDGSRARGMANRDALAVGGIGSQPLAVMTACGPSRHFAATQYPGRFRGEADMTNRKATGALAAAPASDSTPPPPTRQRPVSGPSPGY